MDEKCIEHFGLKTDPFRNDFLSSDEMFWPMDFRRARNAVLEAAKRQGFAALIGEVGSGKSTIMGTVIADLRKTKVNFVIQPFERAVARITDSGLMEALIRDISDGRARAGGTREKRAETLFRLVEQRLDRNERLILVLEEAHLLPPACFKVLKRLWEIQVGYMRGMAIILVGQPELRARLAQDDLREIGQRCHRVEIASLDGKVPAYLEHRVSRAGGTVGRLFDADAIKAMQRRLNPTGRRSAGLDTPLGVNAIASQALEIAYDIGQKKVTAEIVEGL